MFELIEIELTRVRRMAEHADDRFLLYLIDIAIIEANAKARSTKNTFETIVPVSLEHAYKPNERKLSQVIQMVGRTLYLQSSARTFS